MSSNPVFKDDEFADVERDIAGVIPAPVEITLAVPPAYAARIVAIQTRPTDVPALTATDIHQIVGQYLRGVLEAEPDVDVGPVLVQLARVHPRDNQAGGDAHSWPAAIAAANEALPPIPRAKPPTTVDLEALEQTADAGE